ncbi:DNA primase, partial [Amphibiibacter pelophylacis]
MIPPGFVNELLDRTDIVKVVGRAVSLKKAGALFKGLCPFHGEKTPSFVVTPQRGTWHCFGCGVHGNAVGFLMDHHGLGFVEAVQDLASMAGMTVPEERPATPAQRAQRQQQVREQQTLVSVMTQAQERYVQQLAATPRPRSYLDRRGLNEAVIRTYGLGYAPAGWDFLARHLPADPAEQALWVTAGLVIAKGDEDSDTAPDPGRTRRHHDRFRDRVMFPIRSVKGDIIGFGGRVLDQGEPKYLNSPETPVFSKGKELYGLYEGRQAIRKQGYALMVEGYMDVVALAQSGLGNAVATLGTACTADHLHKLLRFTDSVVFAFDGDAAGRRAAVRALQAALPLATDTRRLRFLFLPTEHDPDSFVRELGLDAFRAQVDAALPLSRLLQQHVTEGLDQGSAEDRTLALARAQPLWSQFPEGLLAEQVLIELARWAGMDPEAVRRHWQAQAQARQGPGSGTA